MDEFTESDKNLIESFIAEEQELMDNLAFMEDIEKKIEGTISEFSFTRMNLCTVNDYPEVGYFTVFLDKDSVGVARTLNKAIAFAFQKKADNIKNKI